MSRQRPRWAPGGPGDDIDAQTLAEAMGWSAAMGTPDELLDTLILVGFLDVGESADERDQRLHIHEWQEWVAFAGDPTETLSGADAPDETDTRTTATTAR